MKNIKTDPARILLIGIGNNCRGDDGLGWRFTDLVKQAGNDLIHLEYRYQLQVEDTVIVKDFETVIFADASQETLKEGFEIKPCSASGFYFFSSHIQSPETLLYLAKVLYNKFPHTYTMAISGHYWGLETSLSKEAEKNLQSAFDFFINEFLPSLQHKNFLNENKWPSYLD